MQRKWLFILVFLVTFSISLGQAYSAPLQNTKIVYVPLDDRPVNLAYVVDTFKNTPAKLVTAPEKYLSQGTKKVAAMDDLWQWVENESRRADVVILSADTMIYGGLVPSRLHQLDQQVLEERLNKLSELKKKHPRLKVYVFSTIMRSPKMSNGGVEPDYYTKYGPKIFKLTALQDKEGVEGLSTGEKDQLKKLTDQVPPEFLKDWLERRQKNFVVNEKLIQLTKDGAIDYFILARDDTSVYSQSTKEYRLLAKEAASLENAPFQSLKKFHSFSGADEVGMIMLTRACNLYKLSKVYSFYTPGVGSKTIPNYEDQAVGENIRNHIFAAGGVPTTDAQEADLFLAVNTPKNGLTKEASSSQNNLKVNSALKEFITTLSNYLQVGNKVALTDIAFSNGGDNALMHQLAQRKMLDQLQAYAGWNTAGNSIGYALGQGLMAPYLTLEQKNSLLETRLLDDWAYQANIRAQVSRDLLQPNKISYTALGDKEEWVTAETQKLLEDFKAANFKDSFSKEFQIRFPWQRMFDVEIKITN